MLFNTPVYFVFLLLVVSLYWRLRFRAQNVLLLAASYAFYSWWDWRFSFLMATSTVVDYFLAAQIDRTAHPARRRLYLILSLVMNLGFLGFFKYCNFFIDTFSRVAGVFGLDGHAGPILNIVLPAGISFYTFQAVAYIVDVYAGKLRPARNLIDYALFISLFPHLVAGPIQRPGHLLPQVQSARRFDPRMVFDGLMLILTGLFRKCVIADNCALLANAAFGGQLGAPSLVTVLLGAYAFAWQIYGDFSGYSDIARGSAQLLGFHFMVNFRQPYLATSCSEFWRRWHISLSTWLRDYLYIPLGGSRQGLRRTYLNLLLTMLLGGLWHGANWVFAIWGVFHGVGLAVERWWKGGRKAVAGTAPAQGRPAGGLTVWLKRILLFHFICAGWIFFRSQSLAAALKMFAGCASFAWAPVYLTAINFLVVFTVPLLLLDLRLEQRAEEYPFQHAGLSPLKRSFALRSAFGGALLVTVLLLAANQSSAFIYFRF